MSAHSASGSTVGEPLQVYQNPDTSEGQWTPETVLSTLPKTYPTKTTSPLPFFHLIERLKTTKRSGWILSGVPNPESLADHMYRMAIMTMLCPASLAARIDVNRCTRMALVHDMAEALVGDITPRDGVSKSEKARRELAVMEFLAGDMLGSVDGGEFVGPAVTNQTRRTPTHGPGAAGREFLELFNEYENQITVESHFVKDIDKMELLIQRLDYERTHAGEKDLSSYSWVVREIKSAEVRAWAADVQREREEVWASWGKTPPEPMAG